MTTKYEAKTFNLDVEGLSAVQIEQHQKLYQGYVTNTNTVLEKIDVLIKENKFGTPEYNELKRRFGWEYNGVRLHELYFNNLKKGVSANQNSNLYQEIVKQFGSFETFKTDFMKTATMRGIGWAILYQDLENNALFNVWIGDHHEGHPAGAQPLLVCDIWEHAYTVDFKPTERPLYVETFMKNINWTVVEARFKK